MSDWDTRFLELAGLVSTWSKDASTKVGAVIVDPNNRIVSVGFNGFPRRVPDIDLPRDDRLRRTIHAETNAILFANRPVEGCTIYVSQHPCAQCAAKLVQVGIDRIVVPKPIGDFAARWADDITAADQMLGEAGVIIDLV